LAFTEKRELEMPKAKVKGTELSVFKGKKADLTIAILQMLSNEALLKYEVHKAIVKQGFKVTHYGTVKKRIIALEQAGYLKQVGVRKTQPGSEGILYEATFKALAAMEQRITDDDDLFKNMDEETAIEYLALHARIKKHSF
jgi:DNA-binding PadR family transcriptional regulator